MCNLDDQIQVEKRGSQPNEVLKRALEDAGMPAMSLNALRHSYAINLLNLGYSLSIVAMMIGDTIAVAEKYYTGHVLQENIVSMIAERVKGI